MHSVMPVHAGIHPDGARVGAGATMSSVVTLLNLTNLLYTGRGHAVEPYPRHSNHGAWQ